MKKRIEYTEEPLGNPRVIEDFLPSPEELAFREESIKVTISLSKRSVEFFKEQAHKHHTQYQKMIRRLIDQYAAHHASRSQEPASTRRRRQHGGRRSS
jgi:predicted DNA binding CopG/RHH family protein